MTTNLQFTPYLPRQRNFPNDDVQALGVVLDKTYIEIASKVNERIIGIFAIGFPVVTGEQWFIQGQPQKQQTLRQFYTGNSSASIPHGIKLAQIDRLTKMYGTYTDGTNWYGLIAANNVAIPNQLSFYVDPTNIVFLGTPIPTQVNVVLEWLSDF